MMLYLWNNYKSLKQGLSEIADLLWTKRSLLKIPLRRSARLWNSASLQASWYPFGYINESQWLMNIGSVTTSLSKTLSWPWCSQIMDKKVWIPKLFIGKDNYLRIKNFALLYIKQKVVITPPSNKLYPVEKSNIGKPEVGCWWKKYIERTIFKDKCIAATILQKMDDNFFKKG